MDLKIFLTSNLAVNFNYLKTFKNVLVNIDWKNLSILSNMLEQLEFTYLMGDVDLNIFITSNLAVIFNYQNKVGTYIYLACLEEFKHNL